MEDRQQVAIEAVSGLVGGVVSGAVGVMLYAPLDRVKLLLQLQAANPQVTRPYCGIVDCFRRVYLEQGFLSFGVAASQISLDASVEICGSSCSSTESMHSLRLHLLRLIITGNLTLLIENRPGNLKTLEIMKTTGNMITLRTMPTIIQNSHRSSVSNRFLGQL